MRGLMIVSNGMEDLESLATRALLIRAGLSVKMGTYETTDVVTTAFGLSIKADLSCHTAELEAFDFLIIPGGGYVARVIDEEPHIMNLAKQFAQADKLIAAICAGPRFLGRSGLLDGKQYTAYPGSEVDSPLGYLRHDLKAVTDGNIITGRGAGAVYEFAYQIVKHLVGEKSAQALLESIVF